MLKLSDNAAAALENLRQAEGIPESHDARLTGGAQPSGDIVVRLEFVENRDQEDAVAEQAGTEILVDPELAEPLSDVVLDVEDTGEGLSFIFIPQGA
ncbi:MAG TPA: hypothetical protein VJ938_03620 [Acidimicrobiia bacterium]|nr:hypothetical protein [Acidimicrobiia bacterium]